MYKITFRINVFWFYHKGNKELFIPSLLQKPWRSFHHLLRKKNKTKIQLYKFR